MIIKTELHLALASIHRDITLITWMAVINLGLMATIVAKAFSI
jgi:hypothetical protein